MAKDIKVYMLFGKSTVRAYESYYDTIKNSRDFSQEQYDEAIEAIKNEMDSDEKLLVREFNTHEEAAAYFLGMSDIDGWEGSLEITKCEFDLLKKVVDGNAPKKEISEDALDSWHYALDSLALSQIQPGLYEEIMASADPERCSIDAFINEEQDLWDSYDYEDKLKIYNEFKEI